MDLRAKQKERYLQQIKLPLVGEKGQKRILAAKVLIIGAGGLGSPLALYLAAAGVGKIGIVDSDKVELNNLQRQIIHTAKDIDRAKVDSAETKIRDLNPEVEVKSYKSRLTAENIMEIIKGYDIICDCSDNFPTRYLVNDACVLVNKPLVHASVFGFDGQAMTIIPKKGPCYRCLYPEPALQGEAVSCRQAGVLGAAVGVLGTIAAVEVLKLILRIGRSLTGRLLIFNGLDSSFKTVRVLTREDCAICSQRPAIKKLLDYEVFCQMTP
jgi:molybdopterin/thiamine biosynthesis adenylyltransferase